MATTPDEPTRPAAVGTAGRYALGRLLGRGGMADVYQARDQVLGRDVAVKLLRDRTSDPVARARFMDEARLLASLNHPNLVAILDAGIDDEHPFLVLQLVAGSTLTATLREEGQSLPADQVAAIGGQVAAALAHCHANGVVHRDIKPGNILVDADGRAMLTDLGIARLLEDSAHHTQTGSTIGTAGYLAPEQVRGEEITTAVDLYALGLVLLEACTGRREYPGTPLEAAVARLHRDPRIPADLPSPLPEVLAALTCADPASRPDAARVAQVLGAGLDWDVATMPHDLSGVAGSSRETPRWRWRPSPLATTGWALAAAVALCLVLVPRAVSKDAPTPRVGSVHSVGPSSRVSPDAAVTPAATHPASSAASRTPHRAAPRPATHRAKPRPAHAAHAAPKPPKAPKPAKGAPGHAHHPAHPHGR